VFSAGYTDVSAIATTAGIHHWLYTVGVRSESDIFTMAVGGEILSLALVIVSLIQIKMARASNNMELRQVLDIAYTAPGYRINYHISTLLGVTSILWAGHIVHVAIPYSRGTQFKGELEGIVRGDWLRYALLQDTNQHIYGSKEGSGDSILTFIGGMKESTGSLYLSDIAHHHLALGVLLIWASHLYTSIYRALGHRMRDIASTSALSIVANKSLDLELSIALAVVAQASAYLAQHLYSLPAYVFITTDYVTIVAIYVTTYG
jgi:photosystem I P700 chlorophyll a apoprotein A2